MGSSSQGTQSSLNWGQRQISNQMYQLLNGKLDNPAVRYPGQLTADLVPQYKAVTNLLDSYNPAGQRSDVDQAFKSALSGNPAYTINTKTSRAYFKDAVVTPMMRTFNQQIKPQINEAYAGAGALWSSRRGDAIGKALGNLQGDMTAQAATLAQNNQSLQASLADSAAQRRMQALGMSGQITAQPLQNALYMEQALQPYQSAANARTDAMRGEFMRMQPENSPWTNLAMAYTGQSQMAMFNKQSDLSKGVGIGTSAIGGAIPGLMAGGPVGGILGALIGAGTAYAGY